MALMGASDVNIALVGPGAVGELHVAALRSAGARVGVVVGRDHEEAAAFAACHSIPTACAALDEALDRHDVDAVVVASPSQFHARQAMVVLSAGKPVLCEVPCALSLSEAEQLAEVADSENHQVMVAHTLRFAEPYLEVRGLVETGHLDVRHLVGRELQRRHENVGWTGGRRDWVDDVLWHHAGHLIDVALWFLDTGEVTVSGELGPIWGKSGRPMDASAVLAAPDGDIASLSLSYHSSIPSRDIVVIAEDQTFGLHDGLLVRNGVTVIDSGGFEAMTKRAMLAQDREFLNCILENRAPQAKVADILPAMRVIDQLAQRQR